jgi:hypothetical protein
MAETHATTHTQERAAAEKVTPARGDASKRATPAAGGFPGNILRRIYDKRGGWYSGAALSAAGLYALGILGPAAMATSFAHAIHKVDLWGWRSHMNQIWAVTLGDPQPWSQVAVLDSLVGISFLNMWIAFRERSLPRALAFIGTNYVMGMLTGRRAMTRMRISI